MEFIKQIGGISETTIGPIDNIGKNYNSIIFFSNDLESFRDNRGMEIQKDILMNWAGWLNKARHSELQKTKYLLVSPSEKGIICDENWCCIYKAEWMSGTSAVIIGYGNTEEEALQNCKNNFKVVQDKFNPNGATL